MSILSAHHRRPFVQAQTGLLVVAHGSRDARAATVAHEVAAGVSARHPEVWTRAAFLELAEPTPDEVLDEFAAAGLDSVDIVPFLLGHAYHSKVDLPKVRTAAGQRQLRARLGSVLGPDPVLGNLLTERLRETGAAFDAIVLAAAGSSDPEGNAGVFDLAQQLSAVFEVPVTAGFASATRPDIETAVHRASAAGRVAVATYVLAPGYFADAIREAAIPSGAVTVTEPLGSAPAIIELVTRRLMTSPEADRIRHCQ